MKKFYTSKTNCMYFVIQLGVMTCLIMNLIMVLVYVVGLPVGGVQKKKIKVVNSHLFNGK